MLCFAQRAQYPSQQENLFDYTGDLGNDLRSIEIYCLLTASLGSLGSVSQSFSRRIERNQKRTSPAVQLGEVRAAFIVVVRVLAGIARTPFKGVALSILVL